MEDLRGRADIPCALTIAGSDSGGGAGVQADLKTFSALGVYGACAITAITAQNTRGVYEVFPLPPSLVSRQIEVVVEDLPITVAKTGMLYSRPIIRVVAEAIDAYGLRVVVDPVFQAGTGTPLLLEGDREFLVRELIPRALVVTPNLREAEEVAGMRIEGVEDMRRAAERIAGLGAEAVVVKGGHLKGSTVTDILYCKGEFRTFSKPRVGGEFHGSGCAFSAAITAYLALGHDVPKAVEEAERFMEEAIRFGLRVGGGRVSVNPMAHLYNEAERFQVLEDVSNAVHLLESCPELPPHLAEVGTQVAMALSYASAPRHVAAVEGRIVRARGRAKAVGSVRFGASSHLARLILTARRFDGSVRAAINLHYTPELLEAFRRAGFTTSSFDRRLEPPEISGVEGRTLIWGAEVAIRSAGRVPDVIYDLGGVGKEPMIRVLGCSATDAARKVLKALERLHKR